MSLPSTIDLKMLTEGKERFSELYELSEEDRNKLRKTDGYRLSLKDMWEMAATASGASNSPDEFFQLFGKAVYGVINENVQIVG